jgi:hypothetical protein
MSDGLSNTSFSEVSSVFRRQGFAVPAARLKAGRFSRLLLKFSMRSNSELSKLSRLCGRHNCIEGIILFFFLLLQHKNVTLSAT